MAWWHFGDVSADVLRRPFRSASRGNPNGCAVSHDLSIRVQGHNPQVSDRVIEQEVGRIGEDIPNCFIKKIEIAFTGTCLESVSAEISLGWEPPDSI